MSTVIALLAALAAATPAWPGGGLVAPRCDGCGAVIRVNIVGRRPDGTPDDRRDSLANQQARLGLSDAEVARVRATTGLILCDIGGMQALATGMLAGDAATLITAAHVLRDPARAGIALPQGTRCLFRNQSLPPETVALRLDGTEVLGPGGREDAADPNDYAVVHLAAPLRNAAAVPFLIGPLPTAPGTRVILISAFQDDLLPTLGNREPVAQEAVVEQVGAVGVGEPRPVYLTGSMDAGGSGGAMLLRQGGVLRLVAIVSSTGNLSRNGMPFSLEMSSFVRVIGVEGAFLDALGRMAARPPDSLPLAMAGSAPCGPRLC